MAINGPIKSLLGKGHPDHINLPKDMSLLIMVFEEDPHAILSICRSKKNLFTWICASILSSTHFAYQWNSLPPLILVFLFWLGSEYVTIILHAQLCVAFGWKHAIGEHIWYLKNSFQFRTVYVGGDKAGCIERGEQPRTWETTTGERWCAWQNGGSQENSLWKV